MIRVYGLGSHMKHNYGYRLTSHPDRHHTQELHYIS